MTRRTASVLGLAAGLTAILGVTATQSLREQNARLLDRIGAVHQLSDSQMQAVRDIFDGSPYIGQGNPAITRHPATTAECEALLTGQGIQYGNPRFEAICGAPYMAPIFDPDTQAPEDATACIDQFEFPDIPCEYPVVWVRASEAADICAAMGKRLCDAHEWEGACAGDLQPPDYAWELADGVSPSIAIDRMRSAHNGIVDTQPVWSYGPAYRTGICAASSAKSPGCDGGGWEACGSNTFPAGMFPGCRSTFGVYDLHGNAAEHMNLPLAPDQMASRGSATLGYTEMKGSWFVFDSYRAHEDACRWRAPFWHGSRVIDEDSHHNYHLGFRCCRTVDGP